MAGEDSTSGGPGIRARSSYMRPGPGNQGEAGALRAERGRAHWRPVGWASEGITSIRGADQGPSME